MVTIATKEMIPQLIELWQMGFGDSAEYANFVFSNRLTPDKILVYKDKTDQPIGMLCMEPMELVSGEYSCPAVYMYAFNVHPRFRSRGVGARLLEGFHKYAKAKGYYASVLTPASKDLFEYYGSRGYKTQFAIRQMRIAGEFLEPTGRACTLISRSLDTLGGIRDDFFSGSKLLVKWQPSYLQFVSKETKLRGGEVLLADVKGKKGYIVYRMEDGDAIITEFAVQPSCMDDVLYTLHQRINANQYKIRLSADYTIKDDGMVLPFAMIKWYDKLRVGKDLTQSPYINHVMD